MSDFTLFGMPSAIGAGLLALLVYASIKDGQEWQVFSAAHHCRVVGQTRGQVFNTVGTGSNGQVVVGIGSTPDQTSWTCDDGITYTR